MSIRTYLSLACLLVGAVFALLTVSARPGHGQSFDPAQQYLMQGYQHFQAGRYEQAVTDLKRALAADSLRPETYELLTGALVAVGDGEQAEQVVDQGLARFPERVRLQVAKGRALLQREAYAEALGIFEALAGGAELPDGLSQEQLQAQVGQLHQVLGSQALQRDRLEAAGRHFQKARRLLPDSLSAHHNLAYTHLKREQWRAALDIAEEGLARLPGRRPLLRIKGQALFQLERYDQLLPVLADLYRQEPADVDIGLLYARTLMANQEPARSQEVFADLMQRHPKERRIYEELIDINKRSMNYDGALSVLRRMQRQFPGDTDVLRRIAGIYEVKGQYDSARAAYDSIGVVGGDPVAAGLAVAATFSRQDSLAAAAAAYRRVLDQDGGNTPALRGLGRTLEALEQWDAAAQVYGRMVDRGTGSAAFVRLGWVYEQLGRQAEAIEQYDTALQRGTDDPLPYYRRAALMVERGAREEAYALAEHGLKRALDAVGEMQEALMGQLQDGQVVGGDPAAMQQSHEQRQELERMDALAEEVFHFFTRTFDARQVKEVLAGLLERYAGSGRLHLLAGTYYLEQGDDDLALNRLREAAELSPRLPAAHEALGRYHAERSHPVPAIQAFERMLALDEEDDVAYRELLSLYRAQGQLDQLIERWSARHRGRPSNEVLKQHLIEALHKAGRIEEARRIAGADNGSDGA